MEINPGEGIAFFERYKRLVNIAVLYSIYFHKV